MVMFEYLEEHWALYKVIIRPYNKNTEFVSHYLRTVDLNLARPTIHYALYYCTL